MVKNQLKWEIPAGECARIMIQVEMQKQDIGYRELTEKLNKKFGVTEDERNIGNRIARGTFSAGFFLMCFVAMDCMHLEIPKKF